MKNLENEEDDLIENQINDFINFWEPLGVSLEEWLNELSKEDEYINFRQTKKR